MQLSTGKIIDPRLLSYLENTINEYESVSLNISQLKKRLDNNFKNMSDNDIRETEAAEARLENYRKTLKEGLKKHCTELNKDLQEHHDHLEKGTEKMILDLNTHKKEFDRYI